jgi:hypothetical protein
MPRFHNRPPDTRTPLAQGADSPRGSTLLRLAAGLTARLQPSARLRGHQLALGVGEADARRAQRVRGRDFSPDLTGGHLYYPTKYLKFISRLCFPPYLGVDTCTQTPFVPKNQREPSIRTQGSDRLGE